MNTKKQISLTEIVLDERLHARVGRVKTDHVEDFVLAYKSGHEVEPPRVWLLKGRPGYFLTRGRHRIKAAEKLGKKKVECEVRSGELEDAILDAATGDIGHGLPRSAEDKQRCVEMVLGAEPGLSDRQVAEKVFVSPTFVGQIRDQVSTVDTSNAKNKGKRTGRDGKSYPATQPARKPKREADCAPEPADETPSMIPDPDVEIRGLYAELRRLAATLPERGEGPVSVWRGAIIGVVEKLAEALR